MPFGVRENFEIYLIERFEAIRCFRMTLITKNAKNCRAGEKSETLQEFASVD